MKKVTFKVKDLRATYNALVVALEPDEDDLIDAKKAKSEELIEQIIEGAKELEKGEMEKLPEIAQTTISSILSDKNDNSDLSLEEQVEAIEDVEELKTLVKSDEAFVSIRKGIALQKNLEKLKIRALGCLTEAQEAPAETPKKGKKEEAPAEPPAETPKKGKKEKKGKKDKKGKKEEVAETPAETPKKKKKEKGPKTRSSGTMVYEETVKNPKITIEELVEINDTLDRPASEGTLKKYKSRVILILNLIEKNKS